MNALADNAWTRAWRAIGDSIPKPNAIVCVSAHWYIPAVAVTAMEQPSTIHDFGGFPRELFEYQYSAPGSREIAERVAELISVDVMLDDSGWGLDHGTWSVLCHAFPDADVPVVQLSINETEPAPFHYEIGRMLAPLRDEGVLIVGSGNIVHNLHAYAWGDHKRGPLDWAERFDEKAREQMLSGDHAPLIFYEAMGKDALLSAPTPDHYLPLLYVLATQQQDDAVSFPVEGFDGGSISMTTVRIG